MNLHGRTWIDQQGCRCTVVGTPINGIVWVARQETRVTYHARNLEELKKELDGGT